MVRNIAVRNFCIVEVSKVGKKYLQQGQTLFWPHVGSEAMDKFAQTQLTSR
jgi:hypothetical protein